jgi:hypothetical protein
MPGNIHVKLVYEVQQGPFVYKQENGILLLCDIALCVNRNHGHLSPMWGVGRGRRGAFGMYGVKILRIASISSVFCTRDSEVTRIPQASLFISSSA